VQLFKRAPVIQGPFHIAATTGTCQLLHDDLESSAGSGDKHVVGTAIEHALHGLVHTHLDEQALLRTFPPLPICACPCRGIQWLVLLHKQADESMSEWVALPPARLGWRLRSRWMMAPTRQSVEPQHTHIHDGGFIVEIQ
jgi:hypothetical protein